MTKSELKDIINECIEEILYENKADIEASYRARELADRHSGDHARAGKNLHKDYTGDYKRGFTGSNAGDDEFNRDMDDFNKDIIKRRNIDKKDNKMIYDNVRAQGNRYIR